MGPEPQVADGSINVHGLGIFSIYKSGVSLHIG